MKGVPIIYKRSVEEINDNEFNNSNEAHPFSVIFQVNCLK